MAKSRYSRMHCSSILKATATFLLVLTAGRGLAHEGASIPVMAPFRATVIIDPLADGTERTGFQYGVGVPVYLMVDSMDSTAQNLDSAYTRKLVELGPASARMTGLTHELASIKTLENMFYLIDEAGIEQPVFLVHEFASDVKEVISWSRTLGRPLLWWEIGNERYFRDNVHRYTNLAREVISTIRQEEPEAKIGLVGRIGWDLLWNIPLLDSLGSEIDFLTVHTYMGTGDENTDPEYMYGASIREPYQLTSKIEELANLAREKIPGREIEVFLTEWNVLFDEGKECYPDMVPRSLMAALFAGIYPAEIEASGGVACAHVHELVEPWGLGILHPESANPRPIFDGLWLMNAFLEGEAIPLEVSTETWDGISLDGGVKIAGPLIPEPEEVTLRIIIDRRGEGAIDGCFYADDISVVGDGGANLVVNGGFEESLMGWQLIGSDSAVDYRVVNGGQHGGEGCLEVTYDNASQLRSQLFQDIPVEAGTRYNLTTYVKSIDLVQSGLSNLLENPGFEEGFLSWDTASVIGVSLGIDTSTSHEGIHSLRMDLDETPETGYWQFRQRLSGLSAGVITLTGWVKTDSVCDWDNPYCKDTAGARFSMNERNMAGTSTGTLKGTSGWMMEKVRLRVMGEEDVFVRCAFSNSLWHGVLSPISGTIWFDDLILRDDVASTPQVRWELLDEDGQVVRQGTFGLPEYVVEENTAWRKLSSGIIPAVVAFATANHDRSHIAVLLVNTTLNKTGIIRLESSDIAGARDIEVSTLNTADGNLPGSLAILDSNDRGPIHCDYPDDAWFPNIVITETVRPGTVLPITLTIPPHSLSVVRLIE